MVLKYVLFGPYFRAFNERNLRTVGQTELAERYVNETRDLEARFSAKAQEVNDRYRKVFDLARGEATKDYDRIVNESRTKAKQLVEEARNKIQAEMETSRTQLDKEVASVSQLINHKLVGKDATT